MFSVQKMSLKLGRFGFFCILVAVVQIGFSPAHAEDLRFSMPRQSKQSKQLSVVRLTGVKIKDGIVQAARLEPLLHEQLKMKVSNTIVDLAVDDRIFNSLERTDENGALQVMNIRFKVYPADARGQGFPISCRLYYVESEMDEYAFILGGCDHLNRSFYLSRQAVFGKVVN
jgi:hypothetical protein